MTDNASPLVRLRDLKKKAQPCGNLWMHKYRLFGLLCSNAQYEADLMDEQAEIDANQELAIGRKRWKTKLKSLPVERLRKTGAGFAKQG